MKPIDLDAIQKSLKTLFNDLEKLSVVHSYSSEHDAATMFATWFDQNKNLYTDDDAGFGNYNILPYETGYILNYIRTVINRYDEEARLSLTEAPHIQALIIKHGFTKVVKEDIYHNDGLDRILSGYKEFHDETFICKSNDCIVSKIPDVTTSDAMMYIFANDIPEIQEEATIWLAHYLLLAPSCDRAGEAVQKYNQAFNTSIPDITPKKMLEYKNSSLDLILAKLKTLVSPNLDTENFSQDYLIEEVLGIQHTTLEDSRSESLSVNDIIARQSFENSTAINTLEDLGLAYGIPVISGEEWKKLEFARTTPVLVKNFDFRHIKRQDLGRANFMLIGPKHTNDIRIEIKSQNVAGTAGDKLPVTIRRYKGWSEQKVYGQTIVSVLGNTSLFSKEALEMAREEAAKISNIKYTEGQEAFNDLIQKSIMDIKALYKIPQIQNSTKNELVK